MWGNLFSVESRHATQAEKSTAGVKKRERHVHAQPTFFYTFSAYNK